MTRAEIKNTPEIVELMLSESVMPESKEKLHKRLDEICNLAIKALEQEPILDKIRAEIETDLSHFCFDEWGNENPTWKEIKTIIDKYKAESEDKG